MQRIMECSMMVCEATVLTCALLALRWGMSADGGQGGYTDLTAFSAMCSVSTFFALMVTVAMVVVPEQVCALTACQPPANLLLIHLIVVLM